MSDIRNLLNAVDRGDPHAARELLPLVYEELRRLAAQKLAAEEPGQTLQPTALVHEAYLRLMGGGTEQPWNGRGHFFGAAHTLEHYQTAFYTPLVSDWRNFEAWRAAGARLC